MEMTDVADRPLAASPHEMMQHRHGHGQKARPTGGPHREPRVARTAADRIPLASSSPLSQWQPP
jgi:hypothetical protein